MAALLRCAACALVCATLLALPASPASEPEQLHDPPTWSGGIADLVHGSCTSCHRPGAAGPFHLVTYEDVRRRGPMVAEVVEQRFMPPWHPTPGHGTFRGALRLSDEQVDALVTWVDAGCPEGDAGAVEPPTFDADSWTLGEPDLVVEMVEGFDVPAGGPDLYHNFVVPLPLEEDVWVAALEVRASAPRVLHHVLFSVDTSGRGRKLDARDPRVGFGGVDDGNLDRRRGRGLGDGVAATGLDGIGLGGWAVGGRPYRLPLGLARRVPAGADLILRSHFHPSGKPETERTQIALYFADAPPTRSLHALQLPPEFGALEGLNLEPGVERTALQDAFTLPVDTLAISVGGHAHYLCETMQLWVTPPGGARRSMFRIDDWDFDWQQRYVYAEPVRLPAGTRVAARVTYDNSAANPDNPFDPPRRVRWGLQSTDEMGSVTLALVAAEEDDAQALARALREHHYRRGPGVAVTPKVVRDVLALDADGDGRVPLDAFAERVRRVARYSDFDGDGALDLEELGARADAAPAYRTASDADAAPRDMPLGCAALEVPDANGAAMRPLDVASGAWRVLVFTTTDCPIACAYAPELAALARDHASDPVQLTLVHVDPAVDAAAARAHQREYGLDDWQVVLDGEHVLAGAVGATRTPEVALVGAGGRLVYRGRIDAQYTALGRRRQEVGRRDLRLALVAALAGGAPEEPRTEPVGCLLPEPAR